MSSLGQSRQFQTGAICVSSIKEIHDDKNRIFLEIDESLDGVFDTKKLTYTTYRKPFYENKVLHAWGFAPDVVAWLEDHGCKKVIIDLIDKKIGTKFENFADAVKLSLNKDFGTQMFVVDKLWKDV